MASPFRRRKKERRRLRQRSKRTLDLMPYLEEKYTALPEIAIMAKRRAEANFKMAHAKRVRENRPINNLERKGPVTASRSRYTKT